MKRLLFVFLFLMMLAPAWGSHIVGGEFEMLSLGNFRYRFHLIIYFDEFNGDPNNKPQDQLITVRIFRYSDNQPMRDLVFHFLEENLVSYTQNECAIGELETSRMVYVAKENVTLSTSIVLSQEVYDNPQGYYIVWERCCRNYGITNILSQPADGNPNSPVTAGQTFYLHFPPVLKNGIEFINNSPRLFPPLSDYGCPGKPYYADFAGIDDDDDSLVYTLVTPYNTHSTVPYPPLAPRPFPFITWQTGFSIDNILKGNPDLKISSDGLLTVTPTMTGLFVFAVSCKEFREGVQIGEVRRDFQMLVVNTCPESFPPVINGKRPVDIDFGSTGKLSVSYENTINVENRCFEVKISDLDALTPDDNNRENIGIRAIPIGFKKDINNDVLPTITSAIIVNEESAIFEICFRNECPYSESGFFEIGIIAYDNACALPQSDTLIVSVYIEPPPNQTPSFGNATEIIETVEEGGAIQSWPLQVTDADGDVIQYSLLPIDFVLEDFGMSFSGSLAGIESGLINKTLTWNPKCDVFDFTNKTNFELYFIVDDNDNCLLKQADTAYINLSITDFSQISPPVIGNSLVENADTLEFDLKMYGDPLIIDVVGNDSDNTFILLRGDGLGFNASNYGVLFSGDFDQGSVSSQFKWELTCDTVDITFNDTFEFRLMVVDSLNKCGFYKADTLHLIVNVEPPEEQAFVPPNVFTPNGDNKNAFFAMVDYNDTSGELVNILPDDNCFGEFLTIRIYDRWGKQVFESFNRDFRWYGEGMPVGVYYYYLKYSNRDYKGIVSLRL